MGLEGCPLMGYQTFSSSGNGSRPSMGLPRASTARPSILGVIPTSSFRPVLITTLPEPMPSSS